MAGRLRAGKRSVRAPLTLSSITRFGTVQSVARMRVGVVLGFAIGAGVAVQSRINGALGARLQDGTAAATISFGIGLLVLAVVFAFSERLRKGVGRVRTALAEGSLRWWQLLGGLCGAFIVACQGLTVAAIGVTAFTVAVVSGQLVSSLVVDRLGLAPGGRTPVTPMRIAGAVLGLVSVFLAAAGRSRGAAVWMSVPEALRGAPTLLLVLLPALAGIGLAWQQAVNGRVGVVGNPFSATLVNFAVGTSALIVLESVVLTQTGWPAEIPTAPWLYLGGVIGVSFIALAVLAVRWIGVLLLGLTSVAGQLVTALVLDLVTPTGAGMSELAAIGSALTLIAVVVVARSGNRR